jgi:predicted DNA repair protein MutK
VGITGAVYGAVALIVKADDLGLMLARSGPRLAPTAPWDAESSRDAGFLRGLTVVGTAAMLWVGGSIIPTVSRQWAWLAGRRSSTGSP